MCGLSGARDAIRIRTNGNLDNFQLDKANLIFCTYIASEKGTKEDGKKAFKK